MTFSVVFHSLGSLTPTIGPGSTSTLAAPSSPSSGTPVRAQLTVIASARRRVAHLWFSWFDDRDRSRCPRERAVRLLYTKSLYDPTCGGRRHQLDGCGSHWPLRWRWGWPA